MKNINRICIYPKGATILLGKSEKQTYRIFRIIRDCYGLTSNQYISIKIFAAYTGLDEQEIRNKIL
ncbi:hypothetical protein LZQ00_10795 [Sphingobacterium sp. SRCM116780]|uniref:hypothetical protein n=1 Tax=Sphingobacterium sp. SRCM116780 TaxID=2907623 RepID=UPI001F1C258A|nr:hypothetical protein [Sphingobacterium sp. SRCM116780]UIR54763.1 hypothetical protein LZQ00_10795 [Sphingobacterium sp. SRCM116780]